MPTADYQATTLSLGSTDRRDNWWLAPAATATILVLFGVYSMYAAFSNAHYEWGPYLSPFYSPFFKPSWLPNWLTPAIFILWVPLGFRATCYYYRKAYYRAFFFDPVACAVGEGHTSYWGERAFPFVLQNLHRYFLYLSIIVVAFLWVDAFKAFVWAVPGGGARFGMGVGTLVLLINTTLLSCYTFGCHSFRHLVGGKIDHYSCTTLGEERHGIWKAVTVLNKRHHIFAWASLFSVALADLYVRLVSMGIIHDLRFF